MRLLLFDIDHTLIDSGGAGRAAMEAAGTALTGEAELMSSVAVDGRTDRAIFEEVLRSQGVGAAELSAAFEAMLARYLDELPRTLRARNGFVLPGVHALLSAIPRDRAVVGLGTGNVPAGAETKLRYFGLWEQFAGGGFGDRATDRLHVILDGIDALAAVAGRESRAEDAVVIGDTPLDVRAAHDAGARAVAVTTGAYAEDILLDAGADAVLADLSDTERVLEVLLG